MQPITDALARAAATAGYAPSIHNSQPWHWRVHDEVLDLYADHSRRLGITDPDGRLAVLSCGAALHHARTALSAQGWDARVIRLPEAAEADHLATITTAGRIPVTARALRRVQTIEIRHTDRRPVTATPVDGDRLSAVMAAVEREGARLHVVPAGRIVELASAVSFAQRTEAAEEAWRAELAYWTGGTRPTGTGVPDAAIPDRPTQTTVASRDFGHAGALPVSAEHDTGATFAILYGEQDCATGWLRAGEALSDAWLTATELGLSVLPLSAATEVPATRLALRRLLADLGEPYLVLRLGVADPDHAGAPHTPRLRADQTIERP
ncbi:Acg family FMN-binding oxidoreductase [Rugosimonospora africana]|uniref:NAD(P)H nitroreductase n=1 Tax=Rugosimonospora africana TaxID=556532 RepID=A0A8J3QZ30_9ACTN|nr:nitroreductase [Rugosimonospora africana]GIH19201.1 NAD(P)H nitroreductase [Rugosimonospora africana]